MLPTLTVLLGVTMVLVGGPILTPLSNPALRGVNLEVVRLGITLHFIAFCDAFRGFRFMETRFTNLDINVA